MKQRGMIGGMIKGLMGVLRRWSLLVSIVVGAGIYLLLPSLFIPRSAGGTGIVPFLFPLTLFVTLYATFARVRFHSMRLRPWHLLLIASQLLLALLLLGLLLILQHQPEAPLPGMDGSLGSGTPTAASAIPHSSFLIPHLKALFISSALLCVIAPCAAGAPVIAQRLGGSLPTMTTFMLLSSLVSLITLPLLIPLLPALTPASPLATLLAVAQRLALLLLLPLLCGWITRRHLPPLSRLIDRHPNLSFHTWCLNLIMITGITLHNIATLSAQAQQGGPLFTIMLAALAALLACLVQYLLGSLLARHSSEPINTRQGMFQKNTALAIYLATTFLHPLIALSAGCYVLWQNILNALELSHHNASSS